MFGLNQDFPLLLSSVLEHGAANFGDVPVVSVSRDEHVRLDYRTVAARARGLASALRRLGLGPETMAGSLAWNSHRHLELFYGLTGLGAVLHTANPRLPPTQICYTINFTGYRTLFIDLDTIALAETLAPRLETVRRYVLMAPRDAMPATNLPDVISYEDLIDSGDPDFIWPQLDERMACLLCFTSGTTGEPKGALYNTAVPSYRRCPLDRATAGVYQPTMPSSRSQDSSTATVGPCRFSARCMAPNW